MIFPIFDVVFININLYIKQCFIILLCYNIINLIINNSTKRKAYKMKIFPKDKKGLMMAALGKIPSDLAIINANLVNTFTGEIYKANVFIYDGFIAHVETEDFTEVNAKEIIDAKGQYLTPGFIDAHVHIESSLMIPRNFAKAVLPHGTTMVVTDPHEIANVFGIRGVEYMTKMSENLPMKMYVNIPSCVPSVPGMEGNGAEFKAKDIEKMLNLSNVIGLGEVMDFVGVAHSSDRMMSIIEVFEKDGRYIQGHAPGITGRMLSSYLVGGPTTCHETRAAHEAKPKIRNGMYVDARSSSMSKNVETILDGLEGVKFFDRLTFCTDDREVDEIIDGGHMNDVLRDAIKHGFDPVTAIKSCTLNAALEVDIKNLGAIAAGYVADMLLIEDLNELKPTHVLVDGKLVAKDGVLLAEIEDIRDSLETENSVKVKDFTTEDLTLFSPNKDARTVKINAMAYQTSSSAYAKREIIEVPVTDGKVDISNDKNLQFAIIINRYGTGEFNLGVVKGFANFEGALSSTVSHDSHNLVVVFKKVEDALVVIKKLKEIGGGMAYAENGELKGVLGLNVAGLVSSKDIFELSKEVKEMKRVLNEAGLALKNPLLRIVTLSLIVIPEFKFSDMGMVDVFTKTFVPVFHEE